eukprot:TRINITY_DN13484_c0_g3_i3.p1 TRINITY_DN13484_c0_g3~~TRINITY_DN13484_c0_g3_i3.p1  ORF type:complete len:1279 (+),score=294.27 TRINITY_DN13484_c0_g3_i3:272-3838(+)
MWLVGGTEENNINFKCDEGFIATNERHGGRLPHDVKCGWQRDNGTAWAPDSGIRFEVDYTEVSTFSASNTPATLFVTTPNGNIECEGEYILASLGGRPHLVNGFPHWKHKASRHWIFSSLDAMWLIGGLEEKALNFQCDYGIIASNEHHLGLMPDQVGSGWQRDNGVDWEVDTDIQVSSQPKKSTGNAAAILAQQREEEEEEDETALLPPIAAGPTAIPEVLLLEAPNGPAWIAGNYRRVGGNATANGHPLWKQEGSDYFLFSSLDGMWVVGGEEEQALGFQCYEGFIATLEEHRGLTPDKVTTGWQRDDGKQWSMDPAIRVKALSFAPIAGALKPPSKFKFKGVPESLIVNCPNADEKCAGQYLLDPVKEVNFAPVWMQRGGQHRLFAGLEGNWLFAGAEAERLKFEVTHGILASVETHNGSTPEKMGGWCRLDTTDSKNGEWIMDADIAVEAGLLMGAPPVLNVMLKDGDEWTGRYDLTGRWTNGFPLWQQLGGLCFLFAGVDGRRWLIGGRYEEGRDFKVTGGFAASVEKHMGRWPDEMIKWERSDESGSFFDPAIRITRQVGSPPASPAQRKPAAEDDEALPLHLAATDGFVALCELRLLDPKIEQKKINACDGAGRTALHSAAFNGHYDVCQLLLDHHRFVATDVQDYGGWTALHCAVWRGHSGVCELFMEHDSFKALEAVDVLGRTALDLESSKNVDLSLMAPLRPPKELRKELRRQRQQANLKQVGRQLWDNALMDERDSSDDSGPDGDVGEDAYWRTASAFQPPGSPMPAPSIAWAPSSPSRVSPGAATPGAASPSSPTAPQQPAKAQGDKAMEVQVEIRRAWGLGRQTRDGTLDLFCECRLAGKTEHLRTAVIYNNLSPLWNFKGSLKGFTIGDTIEFEVWDQSSDGSKVNLKPKELLARAELTSAEVLEVFDGDLPLKRDGKHINATLSVRAAVDASEGAEAFKAMLQQHEIPEMLVVQAPQADRIQLVSGNYLVVAGKLRAGAPLWKQRGGSHFIFSGPSGIWHIGDDHERAKNFETDTGILAAGEEHGGQMPHTQAEGGVKWLLWDGEDWQEDGSVVIVARAREPMTDMEAGQALLDKVSRMERRMRVLENVTAAFWTAAPTDEELDKPTHKVQATKRWADAKTNALRSIKEYQAQAGLEDIDELEERARIMQILQDTWQADHINGVLRADTTVEL